MRLIKGIVLFCFSAIAVSACFSPPEFSTIPRIEFKSIQFRNVEGTNQELILELNFSDGDGDLGLSTTGDNLYPFNDEFFYLQTGMGDTVSIIAQRVQDAQGVVYVILNSKELPGKIVTSKTRSLPYYGYLPVYNPNVCQNYKSITTILGEDNMPIPGVLAPLASVDASYKIEDTLTFAGKKYALFSDLLFFKRNPNASNIEVRFWQFENGAYVEYDWGRYNDCQNFFGRFETSETDVYAGRPLEGSIRYSMKNTAFLSTFGSRAIKITARIRDRALNVSNTVESPIFELAEIRVN